MGGFTNSTYMATINSLMEATESKLKNPFYKFSDKKPTSVVYFKQNKEKTTLDEATSTNYAHVGEESPIKFNQINNFFIYGFDRIQLDYDLTDFGIESSPITGEAIILPNTIVPLDGDFFKVDYIKEDILFKVNKVTPDTLDTGSNMYKIEYQAELVGQYDDILKQVVAVYNFIIDNVGTDFSCFITDGNYSLINELVDLKKYLIKVFQLFFDPRLQTFIYRYKNANMYDPYMIDFLIRNKVLSDADEYFFVHHATATNHLFSYQYTNTFFAMIEQPTEFDLTKSMKLATAKKIEDPNSLFVTRLEDYYKLDYFDDKATYITRFSPLNQSLYINISKGEQYESDSDYSIFNGLINYFSGKEIDAEFIDNIRHYDYKNTPEFFYMIPITIFIINQYITSMINSNSQPSL